MGDRVALHVTKLSVRLSTCPCPLHRCSIETNRQQIPAAPQNRTILCVNSNIKLARPITWFISKFRAGFIATEHRLELNFWNGQLYTHSLHCISRALTHRCLFVRWRLDVGDIHEGCFLAHGPRPWSSLGWVIGREGSHSIQLYIECWRRKVPERYAFFLIIVYHPQWLMTLHTAFRLRLCLAFEMWFWTSMVVCNVWRWNQRTQAYTPTGLNSVSCLYNWAQMSAICDKWL